MVPDERVVFDTSDVLMELAEKDAAIQHLQQLLAAANERIGLLESQVAHLQGRHAELRVL